MCLANVSGGSYFECRLNVDSSSEMPLFVHPKSKISANSNRKNIYLDNPIQIAHLLKEGKHGLHPAKELCQNHG